MDYCRKTRASKKGFSCIQNSLGQLFDDHKSLKRVDKPNCRNKSTTPFKSSKSHLEQRDQQESKTPCRRRNTFLTELSTAKHPKIDGTITGLKDIAVELGELKRENSKLRTLLSEKNDVLLSLREDNHEKAKQLVAALSLIKEREDQIVELTQQLRYFVEVEEGLEKHPDVKSFIECNIGICKKLESLLKTSNKNFHALNKRYTKMKSEKDTLKAQLSAANRSVSKSPRPISRPKSSVQKSAKRGPYEATIAELRSRLVQKETTLQNISYHHRMNRSLLNSSDDKENKPPKVDYDNLKYLYNKLVQKHYKLEQERVENNDSFIFKKPN